MTSIQSLFQKLQSSQEFKDFQEKNPGAFLSAGFFILDFSGGKSIYQLDFYMPNQMRIMQFEINEDPTIESKISENIVEQSNELKHETVRISLDEIAILAEKIIGKKPNRIIAILRKLNNQITWNLTCFTGVFDIQKIDIEDWSGKILKNEKMDFGGFRVA